MIPYSFLKIKKKRPTQRVGLFLARVDKKDAYQSSCK
jgi:hypothetical protein